MRILLIFFVCFLTTSCGGKFSENDYKDVTSSKDDINFYKLIEVQFQDGSIKGNLFVPDFLKKINSKKENNIFQYEYFDSNSGYMVSIDKLKSRNTKKTSDKEYIDISNDVFKNEMNGDLSEIERILSPSMKNIKVVQFEGNLIIHDKYFLKRVSYFEDKRLNGTVLEGVNCTNFHFVTLSDKTKYSFNINYYGNDKSVSELIGLFNTIGGSINFD